MTSIGKNELVEIAMPDSAAQQCEAVQAYKRLVVYDTAVPGTISGVNPLHYAAIFDSSIYQEELSARANCVAMKRGRKDAFRILQLLSTFVHPNILRPGGDWEAHIPSGPVALITFQRVGGSLSELPKTELFIVKLPNLQEPGTDKMYLQGFSQNGLKVWSDLIGAVEHVNENYRTLPAGTLRLPLKLGADSILYQKIPTGKYHVLLGDFHTRIEEYAGLGLGNRPGLQDIKRANWQGLGRYLRALVGKDVASPEIDQLINVLEGSTTTPDDIMWEPALWDASTRMGFFREIITCVEKTGTRRNSLISKPALGLQDLIKKLNVNFSDINLLASVTFLRNKIAAHYDSVYCAFSGLKEEIGLDKATIEKFLLQEKPDYMIELIKVIRPLGWITKSPLTRHADYKHMVTSRTRDST